MDSIKCNIINIDQPTHVASKPEVDLDLILGLKKGYTHKAMSKT